MVFVAERSIFISRVWAERSIFLAFHWGMRGYRSLSPAIQTNSTRYQSAISPAVIMMTAAWLWIWSSRVRFDLFRQAALRAVGDGLTGHVIG